MSNYRFSGSDSFINSLYFRFGFDCSFSPLLACYLVSQRARFRFQAPDKIRFYDRTRPNFLPQPFNYPPPSLSDEGGFIGYPIVFQSNTYVDTVMNHLRAVSYNPFSLDGFADRNRCLASTRDIFRQFVLNMPHLFRSAPQPRNANDDILSVSERRQLSLLPGSHGGQLPPSSIPVNSGQVTIVG